MSQRVHGIEMPNRALEYLDPASVLGGAKGVTLKKTHALKDLRLAFVGAGVMGEAMIGGLLARHQLEPGNITASDRHRERLQEMREKFHIHTTLDNETAVREGQVIVLAVKPQVLPVVYADLRGKIKVNVLVISIVAGATIESIAAGLEHRAIVRTMPNTPGQVGEGMTVWTATPEVSDSQRDQAEAVVEALGHQLYVDDEKLSRHGDCGQRFRAVVRISIYGVAH